MQKNISFFIARVSLVLCFIHLSTAATSSTEDDSIENHRRLYVNYSFRKLFLPKLKLERNPQIFISYAWEEDARKDFVHQLGNDLKEISDGSLLDIRDNPPGTKIGEFTGRIASSKYVLLMGSSALVRKCGVAGSILKTEIDQIAEKYRVEPGSVLKILIEGEQKFSFPPYIEAGQVYIDARSPNPYHDVFFLLAETLWRLEGQDLISFKHIKDDFKYSEKDTLSGTKDEDVRRNITEMKIFERDQRVRLERNIAAFLDQQCQIEKEKLRRRNADFFQQPL